MTALKTALSLAALCALATAYALAWWAHRRLFGPAAGEAED